MSDWGENFLRWEGIKQNDPDIARVGNAIVFLEWLIHQTDYVDQYHKKASMLLQAINANKDRPSDAFTIRCLQEAELFVNNLKLTPMYHRYSDWRFAIYQLAYGENK